MAKKLYIFVFLALTFSAASAQKLVFDGDLSVYFDNTEHGGCDCGASRTVFAVKVLPSLAYIWNEKHSVVLGTELMKDFGSNRFLDDAKLEAYYQFEDERFGANAGIFPREKLIGRYSRAFYSDSTLIYNSMVQGIALRYHHKEGKAFAELVCDWEGLYSVETREKFRILFAAGGHFGKVWDAGVSMQMLHFANKSTFENNVLDNILINPYIGVKFTAFFDFNIRLGYLQALQRDRGFESGWLAPMGGEFYFRMSKWGVFIDNNLYVGKNLQPLYCNVGRDGMAYGNAFYSGDPFYGTKHLIYNRTGVGYEKSFWKDRVSVYAEMVFQYNGQTLGYQQLIGISARIAPTLYDKANHTKRNK